MPRGIYKRKSFTQKTKDKMSKAKIGKKRKPFTQETKGKIRQKALEQFKDGMPQETKNKISKSHTGLKRTQEHKDNIGKSAIGKQVGKNNYRWKGNEYKNKDGRILISIVSGKPRMRLARYIAEQCLGRKLTATEIIHHINENKLDDRPENLYLFSRAEHMRQHMSKNPPTLTSNII